MAKKRKPIGFLESAVRKMQEVATMAPICGGTHESEYVETIVTGRGWPYDVFKCRHCGVKMTRPVRPEKEPERFLSLALAACREVLAWWHALRRWPR